MEHMMDNHFRIDTCKFSSINMPISFYATGFYEPILRKRNCHVFFHHLDSSTKFVFVPFSINLCCAPKRLNGLILSNSPSCTVYFFAESYVSSYCCLLKLNR
jgi:hypothetical protein